MGGGRLEKGGGAMGKIGQKDRLVQLEVMAPVLMILFLFGTSLPFHVHF